MTALLVVRLAASPGEHELGTPLALLGLVAAIVAVSVLGAAVGVLTRSTTAPITIVAVAVLLLEGGRRAARRPGALDRRRQPRHRGHPARRGRPARPDQTYPGGDLAAVATMLAVAALVATVGAVSFQRRDG